MQGPSQSQFVTAIAVGALVLVVTAVIMTQKPEWMVAQEENPDEGTVSAIPGMSLRALPLRARTGKAAVALAAEHPGGIGHPDDAFVQVGPAAPKAAEARASRRAERETVKKFVQLRDFHGDEDKVVPAASVRQGMYPVMSLSSADNAGAEKNNAGMARELREAHVPGDGKRVTTVAGVLSSTGMSPMASVGGKWAGDGIAGRSEAVDHERASSWAFLGAVFIALIAIGILLCYNLLPPGALRAAWHSHRAGKPEEMRSEPPVGARGEEKPLKWEHTIV